MWSKKVFKVSFPDTKIVSSQQVWYTQNCIGRFVYAVHVGSSKVEGSTLYSPSSHSSSHIPHIMNICRSFLMLNCSCMFSSSSFWACIYISTKSFLSPGHLTCNFIVSMCHVIEIRLKANVVRFFCALYQLLCSIV